MPLDGESGECTVKVASSIERIAVGDAFVDVAELPMPSEDRKR
ncbi:hypothetical protein ABT300_07515 [Streptomyces sp. NPDC001027]